MDGSFRNKKRLNLVFPCFAAVVARGIDRGPFLTAPSSLPLYSLRWNGCDLVSVRSDLRNFFFHPTLRNSRDRSFLHSPISITLGNLKRAVHDRPDCLASTVPLQV